MCVLSCVRSLLVVLIWCLVVLIYVKLAIYDAARLVASASAVRPASQLSQATRGTSTMRFGPRRTNGIPSRTSIRNAVCLLTLNRLAIWLTLSNGGISALANVVLTMLVFIGIPLSLTQLTAGKSIGHMRYLTPKCANVQL